MTQLIGQVICNRHIEALVGSGGMGEVFRARHVYLQRAEAVKVIHQHLNTDLDFQERFRQEARAVAALTHQHIVKVFDFSGQGTRCSLVMELLPHGSLRNLMYQYARAGQHVPLQIALDLVRQAAEGLAYAHAQGIIHRDIKPDNMLLRYTIGTGYTLKMSDFGLALLAQNQTKRSSPTPVGTPAYLSPEQCQQGVLDGRSDLYALGVVLYELVTGTLPFQVKSFAEAIFKHIYAYPVAPRQLRPDLPAELEAIIMRCLAKDPDERFVTMAELACVLQDMMRILGYNVLTITRPTITRSSRAVGQLYSNRRMD